MLLLARAELAGRLAALDAALASDGIDAGPESGPPSIERQLALATVRARAAGMTIRQQTHEIVALRLHVYVTQDHLDALGVEVTRADVEADALARGLSIERIREEPFDAWTTIATMTSAVVRLQFAAADGYAVRSGLYVATAVLDYANALAGHFGISALDVLDGLADRVEARQ